jgi:adenosine deaminase
MRELLRSLAKAELHVHLEGTVSPSTLTALARKNKVDLTAPTLLPPYGQIPAPSRESLQGNFHADFFEFIRLYLKISSVIRSAEDLVFIADAYIASCSDENITAAEMYVTPTTLLSLGLPEAELAEGLKEVQQRARTLSGISIKWIFDMVRNGPHTGDETLDVALRLRQQGVNIIAIGLAGLEAGYPAAPFRDSFRRAHAEGFRIYAHAGETGGAESVRETLDAVSPSRLGHGIRILEDAALTEEVARRGITLEVCPWSNIKLGVCESDNHPLPQLLNAGLDIVLASDDPGIFAQSLTDNYLWAAGQGLSLSTLEKLARRSCELAG